MEKKRQEKGFSMKTAVLSAAGLAGTVLWQKKSLIKAMLQLRQYPDGWVLLQKQPETYLTRSQESSKSNLFDYLKTSGYRLVDQVADGYFWLNGQEEVILLRQKRVLQEYWSWSASRSFFAQGKQATPAEKPEEDISFQYDMTQ